jgi:hypothetical protein
MNFSSCPPLVFFFCCFRLRFQDDFVPFSKFTSPHRGGGMTQSHRCIDASREPEVIRSRVSHKVTKDNRLFQLQEE